jgi:hypothetical protein
MSEFPLGDPEGGEEEFGPLEYLKGTIVEVWDMPVGIMLLYQDGRTVLISSDGTMRFAEGGLPQC